MYKKFFNLTRNPFEPTPDPSFLFATRQHNEALAALYYGVRRHKGFVVVSGEVGTGKTLLLRCLLKSLEQSTDVAYAYVFHSLLSGTEFLQYIATDFGLQATGKNKAELLFDLSQFIIARGAKGLTTVLVVDEAHHLTEEALEEIRLLTNLETADRKLLQIILLGQPELDAKLDSIQLRQLKQRIAIRAKLFPLGDEQTKSYIQRRLQLAGSDGSASEIFPADAMEWVYHYSNGIPRLINVLCENALIAAYAKQSHRVTPEIVEGVASDLCFDDQFLASNHINGQGNDRLSSDRIRYSDEELELAMRAVLQENEQ